MSEYKDDVNHLHHRISQNRDKVGHQVAQTEATTNNLKGQVDLFKWAITGLTIGFYGVCFWLVTETLSTRDALSNLQTEFQKLETKFDTLENRFDGLENRFEGLENRLDSEFQDLKILIERLAEEE